MHQDRGTDQGYMLGYDVGVLGNQGMQTTVQIAV